MMYKTYQLHIAKDWIVFLVMNSLLPNQDLYGS